ncbi:MAG TPA: ABC transporter substrate-binding protein [Candidatus Methylomirabilis sp.]|nr:ABC transporter substrate-binding protein [Candidatus Methylomirabilis sp.]HSC71143.1 ABC transporter substrate-binding protein [Candidatus Methylomirabilis sp.]
MKRMRLMIGCLALGILLLGASGGALAQQSGKYGGTLVFSNANHYPVNDPHKYRGSAAREMLAPVYSTLYQYTLDGKIAEDLATSLEVPSPKVFKVTIRKDVAFHDGTPVRSSDVAYSFNRLLDAAVGAQLRAQFQVLESVKAQDDFTVLFSFKDPVTVDWFKEMTSQVEAPILSEKWMKAKPRDFTEHMGSGPFVWEKFTAGVKVTLKRNPNYYRVDADKNRLPYLERLEFVGYTDTALRVAALKAGDVDIDAFVPWEFLKEFTADPKVAVDLSNEAYMNLVFNVAKPPFDNKLVRRAFAYAIDRSKITKLAFYGFGTPIYGGILGSQPWSWAYNPASRDRFQYSPEKAKQLLAQAGHPNCFSAAILTSADDQMHIDTSQVVVEDLKAIGCNITIRLEEWTRRVNSGNKEDYLLAINGTGPRMVDPDWVSQYYHSKLPGFYHRPANYSYPDMDALLDKARLLTDRDARKKLYAQWEDLLLEENPVIFLVYRQTGGVRQKAVHGFEFYPGAARTASTDGLERAWLDRTSKHR